MSIPGVTRGAPGLTAADLLQPYLAIKATPSTAVNFAIGELVAITQGFSTGDVVKVAAPTSTDYPYEFGIVVERNMTQATVSPIAVKGYVTGVAVTGTVLAGEWLQASGSSLVTMHKNAADWPIRPNGAVAIAMSNDASGRANVTLLGSMSSHRDIFYEWRIFTDFEMSNNYADTAGSSASMSLNGIWWSRLAGSSASPASLGYRAASTSYRLLPDSVALTADTQIASQSATTIHPFLNPGSGAQLWEARFRYAQAGAAAGVRYIGFTTAKFSAGAPADGLYVRNALNSEFIVVARTGSADAQTLTTDPTTATSGLYHEFRFWTIEVSGDIGVSFNGNYLGAIDNANLANASMGFGFGTSSNITVMDVDYVEIFGSRPL